MNIKNIYLLNQKIYGNDRMVSKYYFKGKIFQIKVVTFKEIRISYYIHFYFTANDNEDIYDIA